MIETNIITKLIFGQKHNGIECALCPTAKRACDRAWFTEAQICEWSRMSTETLWGCLKKLEKVSRICSLSDLIDCKMPTNNGDYHDVQLYNLNVLNQLAMVCIDNEKLNDISCKFYDIMSEVGTTDSYSVNQTQQQPMMRLPQDFESALKALLTEVRKNKALQEELDETKVLLAEEREYFEMLSEAVDDTVRSVARIDGKKGSTALGTAGAESKESEEAYMTARDWCFKHQLPIYSTELQGKVSRQLTIICMACPDREQWHLNNYYDRLFPKWACDVLDKAFDDDMFLLEYRPI